MQDYNKKLTFFINQSTGVHFLLDTKGGTLNAVSRSDVFVLDKYKHLMGFEGDYRAFKVPDINAMKKFKKLIKKTDFSQIEGDYAQYLVDQYPEYFI